MPVEPACFERDSSPELPFRGGQQPGGCVFACQRGVNERKIEVRDAADGRIVHVRRDEPGGMAMAGKLFGEVQKSSRRPPEPMNGLRRRDVLASPVAIDG